MREKNPNQIIRFDGRNVFMEFMNDAFVIGKVQINFIEYNANAEKKSRQTKNIPVYIDMDKFLLLTHDVLSGRFVQLAREAQATKEKGGYKYAKEIYQDLGGISAKNLKLRGKERKDGASMSRQFKITPGDKIPWIISGEIGAGREDDKGLIVPQGRPEEAVRVALSDDDFKKMALVMKAHIEAFIASKYDNPEVAEMKAQLEMMKPIMNGLTNFLRNSGVAVNFPKQDKPA